MTATWRLFVAVPLEPPMAHSIARFAAKLLAGQPMWRAVNPDLLHLTLKFIGDTEEDRVDAVRGVVDRLAFEAPFDLEVAEVGAFPSLSRPKILWLGIPKGAEQLTHLARVVDQACATIGIEEDQRPFAPHLTIARLKRGTHTSELPSFAPHSWSMTVREVALFRSKGSSEGVVHERVATVPLKG